MIYSDCSLWTYWSYLHYFPQCPQKSQWCLQSQHKLMPAQILLSHAQWHTHVPHIPPTLHGASITSPARSHLPGGHTASGRQRLPSRSWLRKETKASPVLLSSGEIGSRPAQSHWTWRVRVQHSFTVDISWSNITSGFAWFTWRYLCNPQMSLHVQDQGHTRQQVSRWSSQSPL